jgi:hypothetical protein
VNHAKGPEKTLKKTLHTKLLNRKKCKTATGKEKALRLKALLQNESKITMGFQ